MASAVSRRVIARVVVALVAATAAWVVFRPNDERAVETALRNLSEACRWDKATDPAGQFPRMRQHIEAMTTDDLVVRIPDAPTPGGGRVGVLAALHAIYQSESRGSLSVDHVEVTVDADRKGARAIADATLALESPEHATSDTRRVAIRLERTGSNWRVAFVDVAAKPKDQPEARP